MFVPWKGLPQRCVLREELLEDSLSSLESGCSFAFYSCSTFLAGLVHPTGWTCPKIALNLLKRLFL